MIFNVTDLITYNGKALVIPVDVRSKSDRAGLEIFLKEQKKTPYKYEIKPKADKRSIDANDKCWKLCTELAEELSKESPTTKEDVYRRFIRETNYYYIVPIRDDAVEQYKKIWQSNGIGWIAEEAYKSKTLEGFTVLHTYWGSSEYDAHQMYNFMQLIIAECEEYGIDTTSPGEMESLLEEWDKAYKKRQEA